MEHHQYLIRGRFLVDSQLNVIHDKISGVEHRLEPRLIAVLLELLKTPEVLVTREALIQKIWDDYPGAEDGLNQAISSLRKFLADDAKEIIKTIPKKGYILAATVTQQNLTTDMPGKSGKRMPRYIVAIVFIVVIGLVWLYINQSREPLPASKINDTEVVFPDLAETEEKNYLNTITTTDSLGNRYRLVMIGDRRPKFYVNDSLQLNMEPYTSLIDKLAQELWRRQKEAEK